MPRKPRAAGAPLKPKGTGAACEKCGGPLEHIGKGRVGQAIIRCRDCGEDAPSSARIVDQPDPADPRHQAKLPAIEKAGHSAGPRRFSDVSADSAPRPCTSEGCPGHVDALGGCPCCAERARWRDAHAEKAVCLICTGLFERHGRQVFCRACKPFSQLYRAKVGT